MASPLITLRGIGPLNDRDNQFSVTEITVSGQRVELRTHHFGEHRNDTDKRYAQNQRRKLLGPTTLNLSTHTEWRTLVDFIAEVAQVEPPRLGQDHHDFYEPKGNVVWER